MQVQIAANTFQNTQLISKEARKVIEVLDQISDHTSKLRKEIMEELKIVSSNSLKLKLDNV